ncbi:MAG: SdpI family protein [Micrococcales bacterium]|nr:SdpI family protein [Micrococcales bacterium]
MDDNTIGWLVMAGSALFMVAIFGGMGLWILKGTPTKPEHYWWLSTSFTTGYSTPWSLKNDDTFDFANKYAGRLMVRVCVACLVVTAITMPFLLGRSENVMAFGGLALIFGVTAALLIIPLVATERALRRTFTADGYRRDRPRPRK